MRKKKFRPADEYQDAELNIMPFIDVFSVLNTFLLFSAVFVAMGVIKVQVPFFSNKDVDSKPKRSLDIKVDVEKEKVTLITSYTLPPANEKKKDYPMNETGLGSLHKALVELRTAEPDTDKVTVFSVDEVTYDQLVGVLDAIKQRQEGDPVFTNEGENDLKTESLKDLLYPKVVMGSVIL